MFLLCTELILVFVHDITLPGFKVLPRNLEQVDFERDAAQHQSLTLQAQRSTAGTPLTSRIAQFLSVFGRLRP